MKPLFQISRSQSGFVTVTFVSILNVILILGFMYAYLNFYIQQKDYVRKVCLYDFKEIQISLIHSEERLLKLNSLSSALRLRMAQLKIALAAAVAASNYALVTQINVQMAQTFQQQLRLDKVQRTLMLQANQKLNQHILSLNSKISAHLRTQIPIWKLFIFDSAKFSIKPIYQVPLQPDSIGGTAPNYELHSNYKQLQALALNWNESIRTKLGIKSELKNHTQCSLTAKKEGAHWQIVINPDKFWSKL